MKNHPAYIFLPINNMNSKHTFYKFKINLKISGLLIFRTVFKYFDNLLS